MPLIKRRPRISLHAPRVLIPGRTAQVRVVLACEQDVEIEFVDVELRGAIVRYIQSQYGRSEHPITFLRQRARVREAGELARGEHSASVTFHLPAEVPPSYGGDTYCVEYVYRVHASVPWWPDARATFVAHVESAPAAGEPAPAPGVFASTVEPRGRAPFFELALGTMVVAVDERLQGALALAGVQRKACRQATLTLIAVESLDGLFGRRRHHHRRLCHWTLPASGLGDDEPLRFSLQLPAGVVAGFDHGGAALRWYLQAQLDVAWARDPEAWIPLTIVGRRDAPVGERPAPLAVGSERLEIVWRSIAGQCGLAYEPGVMHGRIGAASVRITREHGRGGAVAVARVEAPDLGIGLGLRGDPPRLSGRDAAQITWLEGQLTPCTRRRAPVAASDHGLVFELEDGGREAATLRAFVADVKAAATLLADLRDRLPAPAAMVAMVPAWERAAVRLGGRLHRGSMAISGRIDDANVAVRTEWDERGRPHRTILELRPAVGIDGRHHLAWRAGTDPPPASELPLERVWAEAGALEIVVDAVRVVLDAPLLDPVTQFDRLVALVELGRHLEGRRGQYR